MALDSYTGLKAAISNHLDRDDLDDYVDDFIDLAEARHKSEIRIQQMITREALTVNARNVSLPAGFLEALSIRLLTSPVTVLTQVDLYEMNRVRDETNGKPTYFSVHEDIEFNVAPDLAYSGEIVYFAELSPLSDSVASNALLVRAPSLYLYGALSASAPFLMNDERVTVWETLYQRDLQALLLSDRRRKHIGPQFSRVAGATP